MASNTEHLGLLIKDPVTDKDTTFNIEMMLNENWRKIDAFAEYQAAENAILHGLIGARALVESGSYTGTGTFGEEYPNVLTFAFEPKVLIITEGSRGCYNNGQWLFSQTIGIWVDGVTQDSVYSGSYGSKYRYWTRDGNMLSWYSEAYDSSADGIAASPRSQFNASGTGYHYVAIG